MFRSVKPDENIERLRGLVTGASSATVKADLGASAAVDPLAL